MGNSDYRMSFTTGGLFYRESIQLAELYMQCSDWVEAQKEAVETNLLQLRTISSSKRVTREICIRLQTLNTEEVKYLLDAKEDEQKKILWLAICRTYQLIREFAVEVVREHVLTLRFELDPEEYDAFYNKKAEWNAELEKQATSTHKKQRQVLFRMMREAGLLDSSDKLVPVMLSDAIKDLLKTSAADDLLIFPGFEQHTLGAM